MPSSRRIKTFLLLLGVAILFVVYISRDTSTKDFYSRTINALDKQLASDGVEANKLRTIKDASDTMERGSKANPGQVPLMDKAGDAEKPMHKKAPGDGSSESGGSDNHEMKSVAGRRKMKGNEGHEASEEGSKDGKKEQKEPPKSREEREVDAEMNAILKRGPIIVFSKSYCPYSAKAKRILLDRYNITPRPYVLELDQHPLGTKLQDALQKSTGRRTVPNILINGRSIGGGDDIESADISGTLVEKIRSMGGKRILEVTKTSANAR